MSTFRDIYDNKIHIPFADFSPECELSRDKDNKVWLANSYYGTFSDTTWRNILETFQLFHSNNIWSGLIECYVPRSQK